MVSTKSFRPHYGPGVDSASNKNEYQEYFLGGKGGRCVRLQHYHLHVPIVLKSGSLNLLEASGPVQACNGIALPLPINNLCPIRRSSRLKRQRLGIQPFICIWYLHSLCCPPSWSGAYLTKLLMYLLSLLCHIFCLCLCVKGLLLLLSIGPSVANVPNVLQPYWLIVLPLDVPDLTASLLLWGPSGQKWRCLWTFLFFRVFQLLSLVVFERS